MGAYYLPKLILSGSKKVIGFMAARGDLGGFPYGLKWWRMMLWYDKISSAGRWQKNTIQLADSLFRMIVGQDMSNDGYMMVERLQLIKRVLIKYG